MPCSAPPSIWLRIPSGFEIGPESCATTKGVAWMDAAGGLIDVYFGDHGDVAVVAFVGDARHPASANHAAPRRVGFRRPPRVPPRRLGRFRDYVLQPRVAEVAQAIRDRVGFHVRRGLVDERLVR